MPPPGDLLKLKETVAHKTKLGKVEEEAANEVRPGATFCCQLLQELTTCCFSIPSGQKEERQERQGNNASCICFIPARRETPGGSNPGCRGREGKMESGRARGERAGMERQEDVAEVMGTPSSETVIWLICQRASGRPDSMFSQLRAPPL